MSTKDKIKRELISLIEERKELIELIKDNSTVLKFGDKYQLWYTKSLKVLNVLGKDRIEEFINYYKADPKRKSINATSYSIQDYINGIGFTIADFNRIQSVKIRFINQHQILKSLESRIDSILENLEGYLLAEIQDKELQATKDLLKINVRAAGALAGVVLERHLQNVAENHQIKISKKNPTISDLNDPLKSAEVIDITTWRKIQFLADVRNMCSHQKDKEPSIDQVEELIDGVNKLIKTIY